MNETQIIYPHTTINGIASKAWPNSTEFGLPIPGTVNIRSLVNVYHPYTDLMGDQRPSVVNWSAIGSQSTATAELFVEAMNQAISLAKELNKETAK